MTETPPEPSGSWFSAHRVPTAIAVIVALVGVALAVTSRSGDSNTLASRNGSEQVETTDGGPTDEFPIEDGEWRLDSFQANQNGMGTDGFGGTGRVTYTGDVPEGGTGTFNVTVFKDGQQVAYLTAVTKFLKPGMSEDMWFISSDKYVPGPYTYQFKGPEPYVESTMTHPPG